MLIKDALKKFHRTGEIDVNILGILIQEEFGKPDGVGDYRARVIDRAIKLKESFVSEFNTLSELVERLITVKCPYCGKVMRSNGAGGSGDMTTFRFTCDKKGCHGALGLSLSSDAFGIYWGDD